MIFRRALLLLALLVAFAPGARAQSEKLTVSLSRDLVSIQSNFTGEQLALFGALLNPAAPNVPYDVVATVRGPRGAVTVRKKEKWGPFWLNLDNRRYIAIPAFIAVLSNRNPELIASAEVREDLRIGTAALIPAQTAARGNDPEFRAALQRIREDEGLFYEDEEAVRFLAPGIFQARIELPGIAPLGKYDVDVVLFQNGVAIASQSLSFSVNKSGAEQVVARGAFVFPLAYGLITTFIALFFGWLASMIFRRD